MTSVAALILAAMRAHGGDCMSYAALSEASGLSVDQVERAIGTLSRNQLASMVKPGCYRLTEAGMAGGEASIKCGPKGPTGRRGPRRESLRAKCWHALRIMRKATLRDLIEAADGDGARRAVLNNVQKYISALERAGIVRALPRREAGTKLTSNGFKVWLLVRDVGRQAPVYDSRNDLLIDPNSGTQTPVPARRQGVADAP